MFKGFVTNVVISKGYDETPALKFSEKGDSVRFRIGKKVYDPRAENENRWINMPVKAFGAVCERIKKMQLKEGSYVNLLGRLDEDVWTDKNTQEEKRMMVIIVDDIEYASGGGKSKEGQNQGTEQPSAKTEAPKQTAPANNPMESESFTGFEPFGAGNMFSVE